MRIFAVSDLHIDYDANARWVRNVSSAEHQDDVLIVAGDVSDALSRLAWCLETLAARFRAVAFVPGNHELWVIRENRGKTSLQKYDEVRAVARSSGASTEPLRVNGVAVVPIPAWYDYSFGEPSEDLLATWMDYRACVWPEGYGDADVLAHLLSTSDPFVPRAGETVITYSHFLPRIDLMPHYIPPAGRLLYPVLGAARLDVRLRELQSSVHVYGHSHVRRNVMIDGVTYVNNAFGYPSEFWNDSKGLVCIHDC